MTVLQNNLKKILSELSGKAKLLAVTKTVTSDTIRELYSLGQRDFGENRVKDLEIKANELKDLTDIRWHFIGNLQRKKVKDLFSIPNLYAIHSIDSQKLIDELIKRQDELTHDLKLFIQVNTSHEEQKSGFENINEITQALTTLSKSAKLKAIGLMTMATIRTQDQEAEALRCFKDLNQLKEDLGVQSLELSIGMSQDYQIALKVGTDWVRIGSLLYKS